MSDVPETPILDHLRRIEEKLDMLRENVTDLQERMDSLDGQIISILGILAPRAAPTS